MEQHPGDRPGQSRSRFSQTARPLVTDPIEQPLLQHFGTLVSEGALGRVVPVGDAALLVGDDDGMECRLGDAAESLLGSTDLVGEPEQAR